MSMQESLDINSSLLRNWRSNEAYLIAKCFRKKGCDYYNLLGIIFNNSTATGALSRASTQMPLSSDEKVAMQHEFMTTGFYVNANKGSWSELDVDFSDSPSGMKHSSTGTSSNQPSKYSRLSMMDS
uniref:Uncharacterized protein n=1 Tax=Davidia involucrata TaxID=16924 RepID=A0A5B6YM85_DAVIN